MSGPLAGLKFLGLPELQLEELAHSKVI